MKERNNLLPLDGGKSRQEVIDRRATLQVVDERLDRNARPDEDRGTAQDVRRRTDDGLGHGLTLTPRESLPQGGSRAPNVGSERRRRANARVQTGYIGNRLDREHR